MYRMWSYRSKIIDIVDGDTMDLSIDTGFQITVNERIRLSSVDTHEISFVSKDSEEYRRGMEEYQYVQDWVEQGRENWKGNYPFILFSEKTGRGSYNRYLGYIIRRSDGSELNEDLLENFDDIEYT